MKLKNFILFLEHFFKSEKSKKLNTKNSFLFTIKIQI